MSVSFTQVQFSQYTTYAVLDDYSDEGVFGIVDQGTKIRITLIEAIAASVDPNQH